jgi:hypothetical protein
VRRWESSQEGRDRQLVAPTDEPTARLTPQRTVPPMRGIINASSGSSCKPNALIMRCLQSVGRSRYQMYNKPMESPFPGLDPYLEHPSLWPDVHNRLIAALADELSQRVAPRYYVGLERRTYP